MRAQDRTLPFSSPRALVRVFAKAFTLLVLFNFAWVITGRDPTMALMALNTWPLAGQPGTPRLTAPNAYVLGQMPLDALIAAHQIAFTPKTADEFRVIVLGDSAQWGMGLNVDETLSAQLTARDIHIGSKRLIAYNLAYPGPFVLRDMLILDTATRFRPDLVIWFVSPNSFDSRRNMFNPDFKTFIRLDQAHFDRLVHDFNQQWAADALPPRPVGYDLIAVHDQDALPVWVSALIYPFIVRDLPRLPPFPDPRRIITAPIPDKAELDDTTLGPLPGPAWDFVRVGKTLAARVGARLLLVNEPMYISIYPETQNANVSITRAAYAHYRTALAQFAQDNGIEYADFGEAIPPARFTDTVYHADPQGWALIADRLSVLLQQEAPF